MKPGQADDSRRAALNLMEDAIQARQAAENLNMDLRESTRRFREMIDAMPAAVYTTDAQGRLTHFNPAAAEISGRTPVIGTDEWCVSWKLLHADGTPMPHDECPMAVTLKEGRAIRGVEAIIVRPDGTRRWFEPHPTPLRDGEGRLTGGINMLVDITERKRADALARCQKEALAMIVQGQSLPDVLDYLCHSIEMESQDGAIACIHLLDDTATEFRHTAAPSLPETYVQAVLGMPVSSATGPCCRAVSTRQTVVVPDVAADPQWSAFGAFALPLGLRACVSTPILSAKQKVLGTFAIYYPAPRDPITRDHESVEMVSRTVAIAIERMQAVNALRDSEARYRCLTSVITDVPWTTGPDGKFVTEQPAWTRYTGQTWEESRGSGWSHVLHPDDRAQVQATWERAVEALGNYESRGRLWHAATKQYRHFHAQATPILNDDGSVREWVGSCTDVHEHALAEQERLRKLEFDEAVMLGMAEGLYTVDAQGLVISINPTAAKLFGWKNEELLGRSMHDLTHYKHRDGSPFPAGECAGLRVLRDGAVLVDHEDVFIRKDGTFFDVVYSASPLREADQIVGLVVVFRDMSQRIAMEQEIKRQASQLADESRRKDEFLAMLSHELRNPLAPIRSAVHLLRVQGSGAENHIQQKAREIIERQVGNLTKLVSDLLEVSRVISGRIRLDQQTVDISQVVQHATETVKPLIEQRKHELVLSLGEKPIWIHADATRMEEVFINLLNNAAKFTDEGGRIEVLVEHLEGTETAQVRVRDTGIGIDKELLPHIFDLFTQADRTLARSAGGLGIGLSLAQRLVVMHGGTLEAHSPPQDQPEGRGSEFIVKLAVTHAQEASYSVESGAETAPQRDGMRVLVVDDNIDQVTMLSTALQQVGYVVQSAHSGPDGLKVALRWRPDVVLLDIGLPGLDGYEVARRLRSDPETKKVRLIALTGYARDEDVARSRAAGFDAHLNKPLEFGELERLMLPPADHREA